MTRLASACLAATLAFAVPVVLTASIGNAALPPSAYKEMRARAMAVAVIQVTDVTLARSRGNARHGWMTPVTVKARVLKVERGIGLSVGQVITIRYNNFRPPTAQGWAGGAPTPILKEGTRLRAWLNPASRIGWTPAAAAESFAPVK